jgi:hypothetical protein
MSKQRCQESHARRRFFDRYGVVLTEDLHRQLVRKIQGGLATFVESQSNRVSIFDVPHQNSEGDSVRVVYDKERHILVSALPPRTVGCSDNWRLIGACA